MNFDRIKYIREEYELTQKQMAAILNVTRSAYSLWELNKNVIPLTKLNDFSNKFSINLDYIVHNTNVKRKTLNFKEIDIIELGKRLKTIRKEMHLTQTKLAKKFNTTHSAISAYENGITLIPTLFLIEFSKISNISLDWFLGKTENKKIPEYTKNKEKEKRTQI